jgi:hypothetical protein
LNKKENKIRLPTPQSKKIEDERRMKIGGGKGWGWKRIIIIPSSLST